MLLMMGSAQGQDAPAPAAVATRPAVITFTYEREGLNVPKFSLTIDEDGHGRYSATEVTMHGVKGDPHPVAQDVVMSAAKTAEVFRAARGLNQFRFMCATPMKGIASSGAKTLSYAGADGAGTCAYDYSENKDVTAISAYFIAMAYTMDEGRVLEFDHRFDRLSLDAEMTMLAERVKDGRAAELENIAPVLRAIINDANVIQRARAKARELLDMALSASPTAH